MTSLEGAYGGQLPNVLHSHCCLLAQVIYDFVDSLEGLTSLNYSLATTFPKVIYGPEKLQQSLSQLNLAPQAAMLVQPLDDN